MSSRLLKQDYIYLQIKCYFYFYAIYWKYVIGSTGSPGQIF